MSDISDSAPLVKRYRREEISSESEEDNKYEPYVPVKERKKQQLLKLGRLGQLAAEAATETKSSSDNDPDDESKFLGSYFQLLLSWISVTFLSFHCYNTLHYIVMLYSECYSDLH